jgi:hypothetical protein
MFQQERVMKFSLSMIALLALVSSCSSVNYIQKKAECVVWKDQKYMGPYSTEVLAKKAVWSGKCEGSHWKCQTVDVSYDESNNVFLDGTTNIGKIEKNEFQYGAKEAAPLITYTSLRVYPELKEVRGSVVENTITTETTYHYNDKCTSEDAIVGGIALGLISKIQGQ